MALRAFHGSKKDGARKPLPAGAASPYRTRSVAENVALFWKMKQGRFGEGEASCPAALLPCYHAALPPCRPAACRPAAEKGRFGEGEARRETATRTRHACFRPASRPAA